MGEEFYAIIKLISGEEILALTCVDEEAAADPILILHNPVIMNMINHPGGASYVKVKSWIELADDDIFVLKYDKVMTITESKDQKIISIYNKYIEESKDETMRFQTNNNEGEVKIDSNMGYISTVEDARQFLEDVFKRPYNTNKES
tara:strand:+ start:37 stop:474 length:438 start_codon:yes stop_codon:yes gene_type:complete